MSRCLALVVVVLVVTLCAACGLGVAGSISAAGLEPPAEEGAAGDGASGAPVLPDDLLTVAELSEYKATARYEEVVGLMDRLAAAGPGVARRVEMGKTQEGRSIPMLVLADPPVGTAEEAAEGVKKGKVVVLVIGNIHAGEVDGKEALPMLAREIVTTPGHPLLKDLIVVLAPIYNADGNERVAKGNRPGQIGPEEGMGIRENAQGLDLNRDFIKLEASETRALVRVLNEWDPAVFIDTHTTNGSHHRYTLTYEGPKVAAGDAGVLEYVRDEMLPRVAGAVEEGHGLATFFYGDFTRGHTRWETFPGVARYGTNYVGLRGRISILSEGYSYAPYRERVMGTLHFVRACLEDVAANQGAVKKLVSGADRAAAAAGEGAGSEGEEERTLVLRTKAAAGAEKVLVRGFVEEEREGRSVATGEARDYEVEHWNRTERVLEVARPYAYIVPEGMKGIVEVLQRHGVEVEELREDIEVDVEVYRVDAVTRAMREFQGHATVVVDAEAREESRRIVAGAYLVKTGQKLGTLAGYMLEPQSEDGLATWNFFDEQLVVGEDFPVLRVPAPTPMTSVRARPPAEDREKPKLITFEEFFEVDRAPNLSGSPAGGMTWMDDGEHFLQHKDGKLRKVHAGTGRSEVAMDTGPVARALAGLPTIGERAAKGLADRARAGLNKAGTGAIFTHENDLYYATIDGSVAVRLTSTPQAEELALFSPDGEFVSFVRGNNLYVVDVRTQTERALTTDGSETVLNGRADWVYYEEVFGRNWRTYWWSPDSTRIAFLRMDNARVPLFSLVDDLEAGQRVDVTRYPRPGEPNPSVKLGIVTAAGSAPAFADLSNYDVDGHLITGVGWWPDSSAAYCYVQDRTQTWLDVLSVPAAGGKPAKLLRDTTRAWVEAPKALEFLKDGSFLITSERTGWQHLYHYDKKGKEKGAVTSGEWEVRTVHLVDEEEEDGEEGWVYLSGTKDSHIAQNLYRARLDGSEVQRLTSEPGSHRVTVSPTGNMFVDTWSSRERTARVALRSAVDGSLVRMLDTNPVHALEGYIRHPTEQFRIVTADGFELEAAWTLPSDLDESRKYPVWIATYAGPKAPTVSDSWNPGTWDQALATAGVIVLRVDPRPASGKGAVSAWTAYKQLGVQELKDLEEVVEWLKGHAWIDGSRIGISGHSYGGFMTAFALTHSESFAAGIAGAPPTDWREYDSIYTERYMGTPQENPGGYDAGSAVEAAAKLSGKLLLVHGGLDDNVHPSNTWKLVRALQRANKQFEMAIYPSSRHGIGGRQYQRLMYDFILRTVGQGGSLADEKAPAAEDGGAPPVDGPARGADGPVSGRSKE